MTLLDYLADRRGIATSDVRKITPRMTHCSYDVRLWNHRHIEVTDFEWVTA